MSEEVNMNEENGEEPGVFQHIDCSYAFNTSQVFVTHDDVLHWARSVAYDIGFVVVIMRSNTDTGIRGRISFVLIDCERSEKYKARKKDLLRTVIDGRKCRCLFKLREKLVVGGEGWMVKLICGSHNHALIKSLVGHPHVGRLTKDEKIIISDMTKSMVKPINILLTLKEHNANNYTTIWQVYNAIYAYRSSIRGNNIKMQQLMKLLEWDQLKDEDVVRDIFWSHSNAVKLSNACNLSVHYAGKNSSRYGCIMRTTHGLPCACELARYLVGTIPPDIIHMFWRRLRFLDQGLFEPDNPDLNYSKE
ncbi:hypothetical protein GmHk_06G017138 [Glycine max]|nr:hypothetical protein GmHk_06G017138 [Glycine max]